LRPKRSASQKEEYCQNKSASKVYNTDFTQMRAPTTRGNKTRASKSKKTDFTIVEHCQNKSASRSKTTTSPTREHPPEGKEGTTKTERRAQTLKDKRPNSHKILKQNLIQ